MLDIAWPELVVIGAVALIAIGPKDMPRVMRMLGGWVGRARAVAREFGRTFEQMEYEAEIAEKLKKQKDAQPPQPEQIDEPDEKNEKPVTILPQAEDKGR